MTYKTIVLSKQAADGIVIKEIKFEQVRTKTIIDGKTGFIKTNDIARLGFKTTEEYIEHLISLGYKKEN